MLSVLPHQLACAVYIKIISNKLKHINDWVDEVPLKMQQKTLLIALKLIRDSDITWKEFQMKLRPVLGSADMSTLFNEFHKLQYIEELLEAMKSFETLLESSQKSQMFHTNNFISKSSILGIFLRKLIKDFKMMSFDTVNKLRLSILDYLNFSSPAVSVKHMLEDGQCDNQSLEDSQSAKQSILAESNMSRSMSLNSTDMTCMEDSLVDDEKENISLELEVIGEEAILNLPMETILLSRDQAMRFITEQVDSIENRDINALPPNSLQKKIIEILQAYPDIKETYYLSFLNYLRISESNLGTMSLQLYFDHKEFIQDRGSGDTTELEKHHLKFKAFRYCALNLGMMHCRLGNHSEAIISLEECIRIAQETNDEKCLKNAVFWLSIVEEERNEVDKGSDYLNSFVGDTDKKVMDNESDCHLREIDYLGLLRFVKLQAFKGLVSPSEALTLISKLVCILNVSNNAQMTRSSLLDFYGFNHMVTLNCQIPLQNICSSRKYFSNIIEDELLVMALCQLATMHASENLSKEATCILSFTKSQIPMFSQYRKIIILCELTIQFDFNIGIRNLEEALIIARSVFRIDPAEGKYMLAAVKLLMGNISSAFKDVSHLLASLDKIYCSYTSKPVLKAKLLILLIEIKLLSSDPSDTLPLVFKLMHLSESNRMHNILINACVCLIRIQIKLGLMEKAALIIDKTLFKALAFGSCYQKGLLFFLKAKNLMASLESIEEENRDSFLLEVLALYDKSLCYFRNKENKAQIKEVLYEQAFVCHELKHFQERNKISIQFRLLHEQLKYIVPVMLF